MIVQCAWLRRPQFRVFSACFASIMCVSGTWPSVKFKKIVIPSALPCRSPNSWSSWYAMENAMSGVSDAHLTLTTTFVYSCCRVWTHKSCQVLFQSEYLSCVIRNQGIWTGTSQNCVVSVVCIRTVLTNSAQTHTCILHFVVTGTDSDHHTGLVP